MERDSQRNLILSRIRSSLCHNSNARQTSENDARSIIPKRAMGTPAELVQRFTDEAESVSTTVHRIETLKSVPDAVSHYLAMKNLPASLRVAPDTRLSTIPWVSCPNITVSTGATEGDHDISLTGAFAGVAETGTLVLCSGPNSPTTLNFLPATHIVILHTDQIIGAYEDVFANLRAEGALPRTVNFITGPSRTADIEQNLELGAHGPRRLHVIMVNSPCLSENFNG